MAFLRAAPGGVLLTALWQNSVYISSFSRRIGGNGAGAVLAATTRGKMCIRSLESQKVKDYDAVWCMVDSRPMPSIGVAIDGRATLATGAEQARVAEAGGADTLRVSCHLFSRDPITTAHVALAAITRLKVAFMAMSPYAVHPVFIAMAAAALQRSFQGALFCAWELALRATSTPPALWQHSH